MDTRFKKVVVSLVVIWLFIATFFIFSVITQKIEIEKRKLTLDEMRFGIKKPLKFLGEDEYTPEKPYEIIKTDNPYMPIIRFNQQTGKTEYWSKEGGGWVAIVETGLVTTISSEERTKRKEIITNWYNKFSKEFQSKVKQELFEELYINIPSWQIEEYIQYYKKEPNKWETDFLSTISK